MRAHQEIDQRGLAMHRLIADKIRQDPALFERARAVRHSSPLSVLLSHQERFAFLKNRKNNHAAQ